MDTSMVLDDDEQLLAKKKRPIGWFAAGLVSVAAVTLGFSHYMPLHSAHQTLLAAHDTLAVKSAELDQALKKDRGLLKKSEKRRGDLEKFLAAGAVVENQRKTALELEEAAIRNQLEAFFKAKLIDLKVGDYGLHLTLKNQFLFRGPTAALNPQAGAAVCKTVPSSLSQKGWIVKPITKSGADDSKYWETATSRAAALAELFVGRCQLKPEQVQVASAGGGEEDLPDVTHLYIGPSDPEPLRAVDAPEAD